MNFEGNHREISLVLEDGLNVLLLVAKRFRFPKSPLRRGILSLIPLPFLKVGRILYGKEIIEQPQQNHCRSGISWRNRAAQVESYRVLLY
jgi:hypothetical protein